MVIKRRVVIMKGYRVKLSLIMLMVYLKALMAFNPATHLWLGDKTLSIWQMFYPLFQGH